MLLRGLPFLSFPAILTADPDSILLYPFMVAIFAAAFITIYSPFQSLMLTRQKKGITEKKMASLPLLFLYIIINSAITAAAVTVTLFVFSIYRVESDEISPAFRKGDLLLTASVYSKTAPSPGSVILFDTGDKAIPFRIITSRSVTVKLQHGRYFLAGIELEMEPPSEETAARYPSSPGEDLLIEINGGRHYPVLIETKNVEKKTKADKKEKISDTEIKITPGEILLSLDDRRKTDYYRVIKQSPELQQVQGVILPSSITRMPAPPWFNNR